MSRRSVRRVWRGDGRGECMLGEGVRWYREKLLFTGKGEMWCLRVYGSGVLKAHICVETTA